jgi:hypothetical protein
VIMDEKTLTFAFPVPAVNLILKGLNLLPHGEVRLLIDSIQRDAKRQIEAAKAEKPQG